MKITAITKLKQGDIWEILKKLGWTQTEFAKRVGVNQTVIGCVLNLKRRPSKNLSEKIQIILAEQGYFIDITEIWPESFPGFGKSIVHEETKDIDPSFLINYEVKTPLEMLELKEKQEILNTALTKVPERWKKVFEAWWFEGKTFDEIGKELNISSSTASKIERKTMCVIRYGYRRIQTKEMKKFVKESGSKPFLRLYDHVSEEDREFFVIENRDDGM